MVGCDYRRVRTVRLRGPSASSVGRGRFILEEAMRTATLPDVWGSRLVLVRSLDVGEFGRGRSPVGLARDVGRRIQILTTCAVHGSDASAPGSQVVFFRDEIEPYLCLITRLAQGHSANAWFWPLAVPAWRSSMDRPEALRSLLFAAAQTRAGAIAVAQIIGHLKRNRLLASMLGALRLSDGPRLLAIFGWTPGNTLNRQRNIPNDLAASILPLWQATLQSWTLLWGEDDLRSRWLAAMMLVEGRPRRLADPRVMSVAEQVLGTLGKSSQPVAEASITLDDDTRSFQIDRERLPSDGIDTPYLAAESVRPDYPDSRPSQVIPSAVDPEMPVPKAIAHKFKQMTPGMSDTSQSPSKPRASSTDPESVRPDGQDSVAPQGFHESDALETSRRANGPREAEQVAPGRSGTDRFENDLFAPTIDPECDIETGPVPLWPETSFRTALGGLFFLVPVLDRLGISEYLIERPQLIDFGLPARLLTVLARQLGAGEDDPVLQAVGFDALGAIDFNEEFTVPQSWKREITLGDTCLLYRSERHRQRRILTDSSGILTLACYYRRAGSAVRQLVDGKKVTRSSYRRDESSADLLLQAWILALRRCCRRRAHMGLETIVEREAFVTFTPTHIDVFFRLSQADIRVRRAGLDVDPGWVGWLGRVVSYHYVDGGHLDGH